MAWTTPRTWIAGEMVTDLLLNAHLRDNLAYLKDSPEFTGNVIVDQTLRVGPVGAGSVQPLEIVSAASPGLCITSTQASGAEAYVCAFLKNASAALVKVGAHAFQFADTNVTTGFASWNVHTTAYIAGVAADHIDLTIWAKHGAAIFAETTAAADAPGANILDIFGKVAISAYGSGFKVPDTLLHVWGGSAGAVDARPEAIATLEKNGDVALQFLSPNTGTQYIFFGRASANNAAWISYNHNTDVLYLNPTSGLKVSNVGAFVAGDKYLVMDANGNVHKSAVGPAS